MEEATVLPVLLKLLSHCLNNPKLLNPTTTASPMNHAQPTLKHQVVVLINVRVGHVAGRHALESAPPRLVGRLAAVCGRGRHSGAGVRCAAPQRAPQQARLAGAGRQRRPQAAAARARLPRPAAAPVARGGPSCVTSQASWYPSLRKSTTSRLAACATRPSRRARAFCAPGSGAGQRRPGGGVAHHEAEPSVFSAAVQSWQPKPAL